jgi:hypothetical protein
VLSWQNVICLSHLIYQVDGPVSSTLHHMRYISAGDVDEPGHVAGCRLHKNRRTELLASNAARPRECPCRQGVRARFERTRQSSFARRCGRGRLPRPPGRELFCMAQCARVTRKNRRQVKRGRLVFLYLSFCVSLHGQAGAK